MRHAAIAMGGFISFISIGTAVNAAVITSPDFSIGLGYVQIPSNPSSGGQWDNSETAGANTSTTQGDFSLSVAATSGIYAGVGATFPARVLSDGGSGMRSAWVSNGGSQVFSAPVTASYNGAAPGDASGTPNYQIQVEITSISIYSGSEVASTTLGFSETTAGHLQTQGSPTPLTGTPGSGYTLASSYSKASWDPTDYSTALASLNDSFVRTFGIPSPYAAGSDPRYIDGLEITGRVHLIYEAVPEPSSLALLSLGALYMQRRRAR